MKKKALLIIDPQNDFVLPNGNLPVAGAVADMERLKTFIEKNGNDIDHISVTLDSHRCIDISHPMWWKCANGDYPPPFTPITYQDLVDGKYTPRFSQTAKKSYEYVKTLEEQGEFSHFIWSEHCLIGSEGAAVYAPLFTTLNKWSGNRGQIINFVTKGANPFTEHFGALRANVPMSDDPTTQLNNQLINSLNNFDIVYLAGEAKSHCVANTLKQLMEDAPNLVAKIVILEDCMSNVGGLPQGFYDAVDKIYDKAKNMGVQFATSTTV